jgi:hypothetical protein
MKIRIISKAQGADDLTDDRVPYGFRLKASGHEQDRGNSQANNNTKTTSGSKINKH